MTAGPPAALTETLAVFTDHEPRTTPLTTVEVADALGCTRRTAYNRLERLVERGALETKKVGAKGRIWWYVPSDAEGATHSATGTHDAESTGSERGAPDHTERIRRERTLDETERRIRTLVDNFPNGVVAMFDAELRYTVVGGEIFDDVGVDPQRLVGTTAGELVMRAEVQGQFVDHYRAALDGETRRFEFEWDGRLFEQWALPLFDADGHVFGGMAMSQEVTETRRRERELERYKTIIETLWDGVYALDPEERFVLVNDAYLDLVGYEREELLGRPAATIRDVIVETPHFDDDVATGNWTEATMQLVRVENDREVRYLEARFGPYRYDDEQRARTGVVRDITDRREYERRLETQNGRLAALNDIDEAVDEIIHAALESSTREGLESLVCEQLAASEAYDGAWFGSVVWSDRTIRVRTRAGDPTPPPADSIAFADDEETSDPISTAIRTRRLQVASPAESDSTPGSIPDGRGESAASMAAVPVTHENSVYGVLVVYAERPDAFEGDERRIVARLGGVVGHAMAAIDRKRALVNDDVLVLEVGMTGIVRMLGLDGAEETTITFDRMIPLGDGSYLEFGTVDGTDIELLEAIVERIPHFERVRVVADDGDTVRFELLLSEPPATSIIADYGGYIREAVVADGDYRMVVELPHGAAVRNVVDVLQQTYPEMEVIAQRHSEPQADDHRRLRSAVTEQLTDRQRTVLEAAYFGGFFEWPRERSGEELAESMNVAPPTLHKHLRTAERKLLQTLFEQRSSLTGD